jgi:hypothetical protein
MEKVQLRTKSTRFLERVRDFDRKQMKLGPKKLLLALKDKLFIFPPALANSQFCHASQSL